MSALVGNYFSARLSHQTAVANVIVSMGSTLPLATNQIAQAITSDYCGNVIYARISKPKTTG